ncbi:MAG: PfkB family carbohydrate kinase [Planctomycetota bacterium]|nr:PfkB family carbohydrate kinase [Planctomycetota bacterium]MCX8040718.1 PfkB family carbohydrate kinase [Planctomycetota bacterium]MDW8372333.1 PfkB family carbohydrate kinase [Planctomycetota bacterium]
MARVLTVTANPLLDHQSPVRWRAGTVTRSPPFVRLAGGKGINVARVLARHGHQCLAFGLGGGWEAEELARLIAADGVTPCLVRTAARLRLGFQLADGALIEDGFAVSAEEGERLVAAVRAALPGSALLIISGSLPNPGLSALYPALLAAAEDAGVPCWLDSHGVGAAAALGAACRPALAKPNREEYAAAAALWERVPELHITDGARPAWARTAEGCWRVVPPPITELNPIGSGDCWLAGYAHGRLSGWDSATALRYAAAAGAANAARAEVAAIAPAEIAPLLPAVRLEPTDEGPPCRATPC